MTLLAAPLVMCLVLAGIHGYLGLHVLARKVIFVDLALAQIAALGTTYAFMLGYDPGRPEDAVAVYLFSLGFTVAGALVFAVARTRGERVPQEAFIGVVYAVASALAVLLMAHAPGQAEHIKQMLVGNVLLVTWPEVARTAALYAVVGVVHAVLGRHFWEISRDAAAAAAKGRRLWAWDFLFFLTFGVVITSSVPIAGVLLVFSYLVVPAACAAMLFEGIKARMIVAWTGGAVASAAGIALSYARDLPTGPSVVAALAAMLVVVSLVRYVRSAARPSKALVRVLAGSGAAALLLVGGRFAAREEDPHDHADEFARLEKSLRSADDATVIDAIHHVEDHPDPHGVDLLLARLDRPSSDRVVEHVLHALSDLGDTRAVPALERLSEREMDPFLRLELARCLLSLRGASGFAQLLRAIEDSEATRLVFAEASKVLTTFRGEDLGIGSATTAGDRERAASRLRAWWDENGSSVRWRAERRRFE